MNLEKLAVCDPEIAAAIGEELGRQRNKIELIASENFVSPAVMEAMGSVLTNKYAEGYPGHRYYGGCEYVDKVETLAIERAKKLFGAEHANVQAHSGANANTAVYFAFLQPGDTIMGMNLSQGGHLSHGSPVNISGKYYNVVPYGVTHETERIDYDEFARIAREAQPKLIVAGASAYPRVIDFERMAEIAHSVGAIFMVDMAHIAGLVAKQIDKAIFPGVQGGPLMHVIAAKAVALGEALKPEFKEYAKQIIANCQALAEGLIAEGFRLVSGGTDNHLLLVDVRGQKMTGKTAEHLLDEVGVTCNKNTIPFDPESPFVTSGIRLGTAAVTTRGFKEADMKEVAAIIGLVLNNPEDAEKQAEAAQRVAALCAKYPMYPLL